MLQNEPLLDKRIFKFIKYFKDTGSKAIVSTVTNGTLLTPDNVSNLLDSHLDVLIVSLNANTEMTYKKLSPNFDFNRVMKHLDYLLSQDLSQLRVMISYVINKYNKAEARKSIKYWRFNGIETRVMDLSNRCGALENFNNLKANSSLIHFIMFKLYKFFIKRCTSPFFEFNILFNGDVILCCHDWNRNFTLGNIERNNISEIFNSTLLNDLRKKIIDKKYHEISPCRHCSIKNIFATIFTK